MGFSQGAIMASHIAYSMPEKIMFSIALSGFLPTQTQIFGDKKDSKLFVGFGLKDPAILPEFHNKTMEKIAKFQGVERHYYPNLTHYMSDEEIRDISNYILRRFEDESHAKPKVILPTEEHKYTFFFIPGLGMTPEDVENLFNKEKYDLPYHNNTKIVLMRSNNNSVTVSKGKVRPSWFDVIKFPVSRFEDYNFTELNKSGEYIMNRIREEAYLLNNNYSLIYLMGFSQGAILTSHIAYSMKENLRFYISLSGNLPDNTTILPNKNTTNFLSCFGLKDNRIEPSYYNQTIRKIANFFGFEEKIFKNMTHICDDKEEIKEVNKYMKIHFKEE